MSLLGSIKKAAKSVAKKAKEVVETVADAVTQNLEAAGSAIVTPTKDFAVGLMHLGIAVFKGAIGDTVGLRSELERSRVAFSEIPSDVLAAAPSVALMIGVNYISVIQQILNVEPKPRPLTDRERQFLFAIFDDAVNYDAVGIVEGNLGLLGATNSVFTTGHRIRVASGSGFVPLSNHEHVLVHEMVHVWQFENGGPDYVAEALIAQATGDAGYWLDDNGKPQPAPPGYAFDVAVAAGLRWQDFNPEQQATFIEVAFQLGVDFANPTNTPFVFRAVDYTTEFVNALAWLRDGEGAA